VQSSTIIDVAAVVPDEKVQSLILACRQAGFENCHVKIRELTAEGWPAQQVIGVCAGTDSMHCYPGPALAFNSRGSSCFANAGYDDDIFGVPLCAPQLLLQIQEAVLHDDCITDVQKGEICELMAVADKHLVDGSDEGLQLLRLSSGMQLCLAGTA